MVLPEKLFGVGLTLRSLLAPDGLGASTNGLRNRAVDDHHAFSTTDLVRFSNTLKVARDIVEEQKRSDIVEVPTSGLVSILDRIKALEEEVEALIDGKKVNTESKMIESSPKAGSESGSAIVSSPSDVPSDAASTIAPSSASSSPTTGSPSGTSSGGNSSGGSSSTKDFPDEDSPSSQVSDSAFSDGSGSRTIDSQDDCAPEHLIYRLGGGSLQRRSINVSEHPLFRRSTNCNLASVAGGKKVNEPASGAAVFKEGDASATIGSTDKSVSTVAAPAADSDVADESSEASPAGDDTAATASTSMSGPTSPEDSVVKQVGQAPTVTTGSSTATDALLGSKASANPSETDNDDLTTITTTMTSTIYTTRTIHLRPASTKGSAKAKFVNSTQSVNSTGPAVKNGTAIAIESASFASPITLPELSSAPLKSSTISGPKAEAVEPLTRKPLFVKNATMPTSSQESSTSLTSQLELEEESTASASETKGTAAATAQSRPPKNETATVSTTNISSTPTLTIEIAPATSTAGTAATSLTQPIFGKNITTYSPEAETSAVTIIVATEAKNDTVATKPIDGLSTLAMQSVSGLINPNSSAATARERFSDIGSSATTVQVSSITAFSLSFNGSPTSTAPVSSSSMTSVSALPNKITFSPTSSSDKETQPESATSTMSRAGLLNGTSVDHLSGFKTVIIPRSMNSVAD